MLLRRVVMSCPGYGDASKETGGEVALAARNLFGLTKAILMMRQHKMGRMRVENGDIIGSMRL